MNMYTSAHPLHTFRQKQYTCCDLTWSSHVESDGLISRVPDIFRIKIIFPGVVNSSSCCAFVKKSNGLITVTNISILTPQFSDYEVWDGYDLPQALPQDRSSSNVPRDLMRFSRIARLRVPHWQMASTESIYSFNFSNIHHFMYM